MSRFAVDPSAARLRETMIQRGLDAVRAENPILDGIRVVQRHMTIDGEGTPQFTVDPVCVNLIKELESYAWRADRADTPVDKFNHCADGLRYGVMCLEKRFEIGVVMGGVREDEEDDGWDEGWDEWEAGWVAWPRP